MASQSKNHPYRGPTWATYRDSIGDRSELFGAIADTWAPQRALYPGSYVDLSPSTAIPSVTYIDVDRRAVRYFADPEIVAGDLAGRTRPGAGGNIEFFAADYAGDLPVGEASFDLLISLYAGPFWDNCQRYLAPGGLFLANASHGDASLAALDPRLTLVGVVRHRDEKFILDRTALEKYLIPKKPDAADPDLIRSSGRGIAYTRPAFAYVFSSSVRQD
ncbi:class I SAM-dependent methyltransferase [Salinibacterium sp. G-O1]|uniref:class I SAM-dependent methyltransferase n=1 Tax=Salinibacterium sp. G-O1 TaxID=3046208 RepID=UPI0024B88B8E|nr:class I SAM-dependent methyltransferase [Salinibacterium sp. G-O1]MDJ0334580.1 class I SAM-dependent methyltransferase [Salinibacterium sp. G-O1]